MVIEENGMGGIVLYQTPDGRTDEMEMLSLGQLTMADLFG